MMDFGTISQKLWKLLHIKALPSYLGSLVQFYISYPSLPPVTSLAIPSPHIEKQDGGEIKYMRFKKLSRWDNLFSPQMESLI